MPREQNLTPSAEQWRDSFGSRAKRESTRQAQNALLVVTKTTSPIGIWEDMLICSLDGDGHLNVVVLGTPESQQAAMITTLLTYRRN
jgi:hypothetical protein